MNLDGQHVLVTGASRGIGAAIARSAAAAGARVAVHYNRRGDAAEALAREIGKGAEAFGADLSVAASALSLWPRVLERFGRLDALVNNAGVALASDLDGEDLAWIADFETTLAVNLTAPALLTRAALKTFIAGSGGRIVNIASRAAFRGDTPDYLAYAASKAGLVALTRSVARAYGKSGVRAFTLAPGFTRTEMAQAFIEKYGAAFAESDIALERLTEPEDIAPSAVFLLSGLADHATGSTLDLNAGSYVR